jgi:REP element-mobilizing transposase RayT
MKDYLSFLGTPKAFDGYMPQRKTLPHGIPEWVDRDDHWFITICCTPRGGNQLAKASTFGTLTESIRIREARGDLKLAILTAMPDHLHFICQINHYRGMSKMIKDLKCYIAKTEGVRWQEGYFDHRLRNPSEYLDKYAYVRRNPVRAGFCATPEDWPYTYERNAG